MTFPSPTAAAQTLVSCDLIYGPPSYNPDAPMAYAGMYWKGKEHPYHRYAQAIYQVPAGP